MVTNLPSRTVTAWVIRISSSSSTKDQGTQVWDSLLQNETPIEPNASKSHFISHIIGAPLPEKVEVIAGVWADGEAFGQPALVKMILTNRETEASANERATTLLQKGLDQNWTRKQYLEALNSMPASGPIIGLRSTLLANQNADKYEVLRRLIQNMLDTFVGKSVRIRSAKPRPPVASKQPPADIPHPSSSSCDPLAIPPRQVS